MITKRVLRYYCEHCKKSGGHPYYMKKHEKGCTLNPDRECRMCNLAGEDQVPIKDLVAIIKEHVKKPPSTSPHNWISIIIKDEKGLIQKLRDATGNCPACILSALRQSGEPGPAFCHFDFKKECKAFFEKHNDHISNYVEY